MQPPLEDFVDYCANQSLDRIDELTADDQRDYSLKLREDYIDSMIVDSTTNTYFR